MQPALKPRDLSCPIKQNSSQGGMLWLCYIESCWSRWAGQWAVAFTPTHCRVMIALQPGREGDQHSFTFWHFQPNPAASPIHNPIPIHTPTCSHCISSVVGIDLWAWTEQKGLFNCPFVGNLDFYDSEWILNILTSRTISLPFSTGTMVFIWNLFKYNFDIWLIRKFDNFKNDIGPNHVFTRLGLLVMPKGHALSKFYVS